MLKRSAATLWFIASALKFMVLVLDFGSQYTQLIARRVRELKVYCEILPYNAPIEEIRRRKPQGIILSGGPSSAVKMGNGSAGVEADGNSLEPHGGVFALGVPILGICYGHQIMARLLGGKVRRAPRHEYGLSKITLSRSAKIFDGIEAKFDVWMSHGDEVAALPYGFVILGATENAPYAAIAHPGKKLYGLQFHPEVSHTENGASIIKNFLFSICELAPNWEMSDWVARTKKEIKETVGQHGVLLALSGGVDSCVAAALLHEAIETQLTAVFVDTGLLKVGETERLRRLFGKRLEDSLVVVDASAMFFTALKGLIDPEAKRMAIGAAFAQVFIQFASEHPNIRYLAQGTLYPDIIESGRGVAGASEVIKTHHNVGGLPANLNLALIEPFRSLFKDEVRLIGRELGLGREVLNRHPFPGPGFAVRMIGEVTPDRADLISRADKIIEEEIHREGLYDSLWQIFPVLTNVRTVGVMGDQRRYDEVLAIRAVTSIDAMTADWARLPERVLAGMAGRIVNEIKGIGRVVYDITTKPPATIEWE